MAMELVETVTLTAAASSIEFTAIPQDGVDLLLVLSARAGNTNCLLQINGDTDNSKYARRHLTGTGSTVSSVGGTNRPAMIPSDTASTANTFGNSSAYLSNYTSSTNKSISLDGVSENNATASIQRIEANTYTSTSAITSLQLLPLVSDFVTNTTASLYKIS